MKELYDKYLAGVRWVELILAFGMAVMADLQMHVGTGGKVTQETLLKALGVGVGVAWAYLRMPKSAPATQDTEPTSEGLPPGVDSTGPGHDVAAEIAQKAIETVLPPMVTSTFPELSGNITSELKRVLKRGIKW